MQPVSFNPVRFGAKLRVEAPDLKTAEVFTQELKHLIYPEIEFRPEPLLLWLGVARDSLGFSLSHEPENHQIAHIRTGDDYTSSRHSKGQSGSTDSGKPEDVVQLSAQEAKTGSPKKKAQLLLQKLQDALARENAPLWSMVFSGKVEPNLAVIISNGMLGKVRSHLTQLGRDQFVQTYSPEALYQELSTYFKSDPKQLTADQSRTLAHLRVSVRNISQDRKSDEDTVLRQLADILSKSLAADFDIVTQDKPNIAQINRAYMHAVGLPDSYINQFNHPDDLLGGFDRTLVQSTGRLNTLLEKDWSTVFGEQEVPSGYMNVLGHIRNVEEGIPIK